MMIHITDELGFRGRRSSGFGGRVLSRKSQQGGSTADGNFPIRDWPKNSANRDISLEQRLLLVPEFGYGVCRYELLEFRCQLPTLCQQVDISPFALTLRGWSAPGRWLRLRI